MGTSTVVSMGDSSISGEAGRWAGNTNVSPPTSTDLGAGAYYTDTGAESVSKCHRSAQAEVYIGSVLSKNLAGSGSETTTWQIGDFFYWKPGLDDEYTTNPFTGDLERQGQVQQLFSYAKTHNVKMIVVGVGANDYDFSGVVTDCLNDWLQYRGADPSKTQNNCRYDPKDTARFTPAAEAQKTQDVFAALQRIANAMDLAGYSKSMYDIEVQTYWSPIPHGNGIRYPQNSTIDRQSVGGCGIYNTDADWLNDTVLKTLNDTLRGAVALFKDEPNYPEIHVLDMQDALVGHRLCETGVGTMEEKGLTSFSDPNASDKSEWVSQMRSASALLPGSPYTAAEGGHANAWGQLAERNCLRQAYNNGDVKGGKCVFAGPGLTAQHEPKMSLVAQPEDN